MRADVPPPNPPQLLWLGDLGRHSCTPASPGAVPALKRGWLLAHWEGPWECGHWIKGERDAKAAELACGVAAALAHYERPIRVQLFRYEGLFEFVTVHSGVVIDFEVL